VRDLFHFSEDLNETQFFLWDKKLIENKSWAILSKSSKAVFPVIAAHCNQKGVSFPGEKSSRLYAAAMKKLFASVSYIERIFQVSGGSTTSLKGGGDPKNSF
jgi:hypothetical protein